MKIFVPILAILAIGCAGGEDSTVGPEMPTPDRMTVDGKNDSAESVEEIDLCAEFDLYGDGECHDVCAQHDPDCGEPETDEAPETDACEDEDRYGDGVCDDDCLVADSDCDDDAADVCLDEQRYADGTCDEDCQWADPDCEDEVDSSVLEDWERSVCSRFRSTAGSTIQELAHSLCVEREGQDLVDCIGACVDA